LALCSCPGATQKTVKLLPFTSTWLPAMAQSMAAFLSSCHYRNGHHDDDQLTSIGITERERLIDDDG
jgi:hypothetical protein